MNKLFKYYILVINGKWGFCMKRKLVIIGANDFQRQLVIKAKDRGFETHVFAWEKDAIAKGDADFFYPISVTEKERILDLCREISPLGITSVASDLASVTVNYVAEKLNLTGNGIESSLLSTNKYLMRRAFREAEVPSPMFFCSSELNEKKIDELLFPVIIKPVDRSGSRGVNKVESRKEVEDAIKIAEEQSFVHKAIIEEYVEGEEYSVEYISWKGNHIFLAMTRKFTTGEPHFIEMGHEQPANVSCEVLEKVKDIVENALDSLKIRNGASHTELKIDSKGCIKIIEVGGRMGGDCIGSDLVQLSTGYDFVSMVIDVACGHKPIFKKICTPRFSEIKFIFSEKDYEELKKIQQETPQRIYRISDIKRNDALPILDSSARLGYYILQGELLE